jgi:hypothetical protein
MARGAAFLVTVMGVVIAGGKKPMPWSRIRTVPISWVSSKLTLNSLNGWHERERFCFSK